MFTAGFNPRRATSRQESKTARPRWLDIKWRIYRLTVFRYMNTNGYMTIPECIESVMVCNYCIS